MSDETAVTFRVFGTPGARRLVVLIGAGDTATVDPLPAVTAAHDIRILAVALTGAAIDDPGTFGSETPAEQTASTLADLVREQLANAEGARTAGILAYRAAGDVALRTTVELGEVVDRLALVAVPLSDRPLNRDELGELIGGISAETLIIEGSGDAGVGASAASWFEAHIAGSRVELVTDSAALSLSDVWDRVLAHLAPGTER